MDAALALIGDKEPGRLHCRGRPPCQRESPVHPTATSATPKALLAEVALRGFERFATPLAAAWNSGRPDAMRAFEAVGRAYLAFARDEPVRGDV